MLFVLGLDCAHARSLARIGPFICLLSLATAYPVSVARGADSDAPPTAPTVQPEELVVSGKKLDEQTLIDRKVYNVQSDVQSTFGTLSDVLDVIPSVDVDANGIVSLRGDPNVLVLIDGRPSALFFGSGAGDNLQSISAADVERIEVMTNPPAQYKADGAAGVINIVLRKQRPQGFAGTVQGSLGSGRRSIAGTNASYNDGPLMASITATYREDLRHRLIDSDLAAADPATGQQVSNRSAIDETIRRHVPILGSSVQYALNDALTLNLDLSGMSRAGPRTYTENDTSSLPSGTLTGSTRRSSAGSDRDFEGDEKLGLTQQLALPGEVLALLLHHTASHQDEHYDYTNSVFVPPGAPFQNNLGFHEDIATTEFTADYARPLFSTAILKLGYDFERDDYSYGAAGANIDSATGRQIPDTNLTDIFAVRQQIDAFYASYQHGVGRWNWIGGLRAELASTEARQVMQSLTTDQRYLRLYPSLHVDRTLSDAATLSFAASRRVTRPDADNMNPYIDHEYTPNLVSGNPGLKPQFTQSYELGYGYAQSGLTYSVTGYWRRNKDSVTDVTQALPGGLTLTTKTNLPNNDSAGIEVGANGHIVPKLAYSISSNLFYSQIDATALGASAVQSTQGVNAKVKLDYRPTGSDTLQLTATRTDKRLTPQGYVDAINLVNLGYRRQLQRDLTGVLTASNVFNGQRFERIAVTPTFTEHYSRFVYGRILYVGLVYAFGSSPKDKQQGFDYDQ